MRIGYQEGNVISLVKHQLGCWKRGCTPTGTGFRRRTMKLSARCIMNLVNLLHRMRSISSACLILMLNRIELTEGSIKTLSFSFREIINGFRRTYLDELKQI